MPPIWLSLFLLTYFNICLGHNYDDIFNEDLLIKPLPSGHVYTQFKFVVEKEIDPIESATFKHFRLFPRSLGEIISKHSVQELHLSLTQGLWRYEKWGYPYRDAPPGAELWTWFKKDTPDVTSTWRNLVNVLSGQFCASLNFIDETNTVIPKLSFRPQGAVTSGKTYNSSYLRYASLPQEIVCTENLTPFKKLLPCDTKAGLSTLLTAINLFNAHFVSIAIDYRTVCKVPDCTFMSIELTQSVAVVFDRLLRHSGKQDWSFLKLFTSSLMNTCPVADRSMVYVDTSFNKSGISFTLSPEPTRMAKDETKNSRDETIAVYDLKEVFKTLKQVNIAAAYKKAHIFWLTVPPTVHASRYITGYGQEQGGIQCTLYNNHPNKYLKIIYLDVIPWFLRVYSHTLTVKTGNEIIKPQYIHYQPGQDRKRPHHLELGLTLPPKSTTTISIEFDYAFLKWTEYPPDANHGFYVGSAVVSTVLDSAQNFTHFSANRKTDLRYFLRLHTQVLLVSLPTPDFSMPYNVICLVCTVVALAFGPIHNITTKSLQVADEEKEGVFMKLKKHAQKFYRRFLDKKNKEMCEDLKKLD